MGKKAIIFPGQGAQKAGMGKDLFDSCPQSREIFERANAAIGFDLAKVCFDGPADELNDTAVCQPGILTTSIAALEALKAKCGEDAVRADMTAGLSLGEWEIINPHERFRQTKRLAISPSFSNSSAAVLALLHARGKDSPGLQDLRSEINPDGLSRLGWSFEGKRISVDWDLVKREVLLK